MRILRRRPVSSRSFYRIDVCGCVSLTVFPPVYNTASFALEHTEACTARTEHLPVVNLPPLLLASIYFSIHYVIEK